jgi:hypothetical protein
MEIYKQGLKQGLRFTTSWGILTIEQLWSLNTTKLATIAKDLNSKIEEATKGSSVSFLDEASTKVDETLQLSFDIVKDIYLTKKKEIDDAKDKASKKEHNQKIMALIVEKQEADLKNKSVEELQAMIIS